MTRVTFPEVVQNRIVFTFCRKCKKERKRTLVRKWYRNGLHDEAKTREKYNAELDAEVRKIKKLGIICSSCE